MLKWRSRSSADCSTGTMNQTVASKGHIRALCVRDGYISCVKVDTRRCSELELESLVQCAWPFSSKTVTLERAVSKQRSETVNLQSSNSTLAYQTKARSIRFARHLMDTAVCREIGDLTNSRETLVAIHGSPGPRELWSIEYPHIACAANGRHNLGDMWSYADVRAHRDKSMQSTPQCELTCLSLF
jgi:hypothetical protein